MNDYTAAQSQRAVTAARGAGFGDPRIIMVQDGNFFLNAEKSGQIHSVTVTPEGKVFSSVPLSPAGG